MGQKHHESKEFRELLKKIESHGFLVTRSKSGVWKMKPPAGMQGPIYTTHGTTRAIKPIIRDFRRFYGIDLEA